MEISRSQYPGTTTDRLKSYLSRMCGLSSQERTWVKGYARRLVTYSRMKEGSKKEKYKSEKLEPFYYEALGENKKEFGNAIAEITQIVFSEVDLGTKT